MSKDYDYEILGGYEDLDRLTSFVDSLEAAVIHARTVRILFSFYPFVIKASFDRLV